jgi:hypothetical protein
LINDYLTKHNQASTGELLDNIIYNEMISNDLLEEVSEKDIFNFLETNYHFVDGGWQING